MNVIVQDLEKEEIPQHMTRVPPEEIKRVSALFVFIMWIYIEIYKPMDNITTFQCISLLLRNSELHLLFPTQSVF